MSPDPAHFTEAGNQIEPPLVMVAQADAQVPITARGTGAQTGDLIRAETSAGAAKLRIDPSGYIVVSLHAAPADAALNAGDLALWFDQTDGAGKLMVKAKTANGTVATAAVALA